MDLALRNLEDMRGVGSHQTSKLWHGSGWTRYPPYEGEYDKDKEG